MGVRFPSNANTSLTNTVLTAATEIVTLTSTPINLAIDNQLVLVQWYLVFTQGATQTLAALKLRRGTAITGTQINVNTSIQATGGNTVVVSGCYADTPGIVSQQQYVLTVNVSGGAGNGTAVDGCIAVIAL